MIEIKFLRVLQHYFFEKGLLISMLFSQISCMSPPPKNVDNLCDIFKQYPNWYEQTKDVEKRWQIPVPVQMAIMHQESKFDATAQPKRQKLLWVIPWTRPSSAYGYSQALDSTWALYKSAADGGNFWAARSVFAHSVDFIGWYANQANRKVGIHRTDPYHLYLAYHEGITGYAHKSYLAKPWLIKIAKKVKARAQIFQSQLTQCKHGI